jgi:hypothetical protein
MDYELLKKIIFGTGNIPENKVLVDPHAHFHISLDPNEIVQILFDKNIGIQAICDYQIESGKPGHVHSYRNFVGKLQGTNDLEIITLDNGTTKLKRKDQRLILYQGTEIETYIHGSEGGFLHDRHEIHLLIYGRRVKFDHAAEILKQAKPTPKAIAHPFTIPARGVRYVYANRREREEVVKLARNYHAKLEGLNSVNALWMTPTNVQVIETARKEGLRLIYSTDTHARPDIELTKRQLGLAGTLVSIEDFNKTWATKNNLLMINSAIRNGEMYGRVQDPLLFMQVMVKPRLKRFGL